MLGNKATGGYAAGVYETCKVYVNLEITIHPLDKLTKNPERDINGVDVLSGDRH